MEDSEVESDPTYNYVTLLRQSLVSVVAADCGKVEDNGCEVADGMFQIEDDKKDYSFYTEKSRL